MPSCTGCVLEVAEGALVCPACKRPTHRGRRRSLLVGAALVLAPALFYLLWTAVLGADFLAKKSPLFGVDERLVYMLSCFASVILEVVGLWFLDRALRLPVDLLTIGAAFLAIVSIPLAIFLLVQIIQIGLRGWG
jgi:hypothetical protein